MKCGLSRATLRSRGRPPPLYIPVHSATFSIPSGPPPPPPQNLPSDGRSHRPCQPLTGLKLFSFFQPLADFGKVYPLNNFNTSCWTARRKVRPPYAPPPVKLRRRVLFIKFTPNEAPNPQRDPGTCNHLILIFTRHSANYVPRFPLKT